VVRISDSQFRETRNPEWPSKLGIHGHYASRDLSRIVDVISAMSRSKPGRVAYSKTGVLRRPGKPDVWLRYGGPALLPTGSATVTDSTARAMLPPEFEDIAPIRNLSYSLPSTDATAAADLAWIFTALDVYPDSPELAVMLLAVLIWALFSSFNGKITTTACGDSGEAGKTAFHDAVLAAAQSATHQAGRGVEACVFDMRNKGTSLGLDQFAHYGRGAALIVDDVITRSMNAAAVDKAIAKLDGIYDGFVGGNGSPRGGFKQGRATASTNTAPTGCAAVTLENIPGEDRLISTMGRTGAADLENPADVDLWSAALTVLQEHSPEIARALSRFIADHLGRDMEKVGAVTLAELRPVTDGWQRRYGGHKRPPDTYARLAAGWALLARHEARVNGEDPADREASHREAYGLNVLMDMFAGQAARSGKVPGARNITDPAELWVRSVSKLLNVGDVYVTDSELTAAGQFQPPQRLSVADWGRLGWKSRTVSESDGSLAAVWEPIRPGAPVGAVLVHDPEARGPKPCYGMRLMVLAPDFDPLTERAAKYAKDFKGLSLTEGTSLRDKLVAAKVLHRKDAETQRQVWDEAGQSRKYVVDLAPILAGTLQAQGDDPGQGDGGGGGTSGQPDPPAGGATADEHQHDEQGTLDAAPADPKEAYLDEAVPAAAALETVDAGRKMWTEAGQHLTGASLAYLRSLIEARIEDMKGACCRGCKLPLPAAAGLADGGYHVSCDPGPAPDVDHPETESQIRTAGADFEATEEAAEPEEEPEPETSAKWDSFGAMEANLKASRLHPQWFIRREDRDSGPWPAAVLADRTVESGFRWSLLAAGDCGGYSPTRIVVPFDRGQSFPAACSSVPVAPNKLTHHGALDQNPKDAGDHGLAGVCEVIVPAWEHEARIGHPLGRKAVPGERLWVPSGQVELLWKLHEAGQIARPVVVDSWLGRRTTSLFDDYARAVREARHQYADDPEGTAGVKFMASVALRKLYPVSKPGPWWRPDWRSAIVAEASTRLWAVAWRAVQAGATLVQVGNTDQVAFLLPEGEDPAGWAPPGYKLGREPGTYHAGVTRVRAGTDLGGVDPGRVAPGADPKVLEITGPLPLAVWVLRRG
jgi:hypothetical protein